MPRSYSNSRSRSRSRSPIATSNRRSRSPLRSSNDLDDNDVNHRRVHVADLPSSCTKRQIEKAFDKWPIEEVWHAKASCFAFVVLRNREDVQPAINELDGRSIGDARVRVTLARPRIRSSGGGGRRYFDPNKRCYQCGSRGHFSRDCDGDQRKRRSNNGYRSHSRERRRERSYSRSRSRSPRPRVIREYRRYSPRRSSPRSNYKSRDNGAGYYSSPPRT